MSVCLSVSYLHHDDDSREGERIREALAASDYLGFP